MRRLLVGGKAPFELLIQAAGRSSPLPAAQGREEELFFRMTELGPRREWLRPDRRPTEDGQVGHPQSSRFRGAAIPVVASSVCHRWRHNVLASRPPAEKADPPGMRATSGLTGRAMR